MDLASLIPMLKTEQTTLPPLNSEGEDVSFEMFDLAYQQAYAEQAPEGHFVDLQPAPLPVVEVQAIIGKEFSSENVHLTVDQEQKQSPAITMDDTTKETISSEENFVDDDIIIPVLQIGFAHSLPEMDAPVLKKVVEEKISYKTSVEPDQEPILPRIERKPKPAEDNPSDRSGFLGLVEKGLPEAQYEYASRSVILPTQESAKLEISEVSKVQVTVFGTAETPRFEALPPLDQWKSADKLSVQETSVNTPLANRAVKDAAPDFIKGETFALVPPTSETERATQMVAKSAPQQETKSVNMLPEIALDKPPRSSQTLAESVVENYKDAPSDIIKPALPIIESKPRPEKVQLMAPIMPPMKEMETKTTQPIDAEFNTNVPLIKSAPLHTLPPEPVLEIDTPSVNLVTEEQKKTLDPFEKPDVEPLQKEVSRIELPRSEGSTTQVTVAHNTFSQAPVSHVPAATQNASADLAPSAPVVDMEKGQIILRQMATALQTDRFPIEITLDPPELGRVQLTLDPNHSDGPRLIVQADTPEATEFLRRQLHLIAEYLPERLQQFSNVAVNAPLQSQGLAEQTSGLVASHFGREQGTAPQNQPQNARSPEAMDSGFQSTSQHSQRNDAQQEIMKRLGARLNMVF